MCVVRNAYTLIDYGDFVEGTKNTADPYVQFLPITNDTAAAHADFVKVRLGGVDSVEPFTNSGSLLTHSPGIWVVLLAAIPFLLI